MHTAKILKTLDHAEGESKEPLLPAHDEENPPFPTDENHVILSIPKPYIGGFIWDKDIVRVSMSKDNLSKVLMELERTHKDLVSRYNNAEYIRDIINDSGALLIALLQVVKGTANKIRNVSETNNDVFTNIIDASCIAIPMITVFISKVLDYIKKNAEQYQKDVKETQYSIQPRLR